MELQADLGALPPENMWGLGDHVVLLGQTSMDFARPSWEMASINSGFGWDPSTVPGAIADIDGGTVIDDHVWFMARVSAVSAADDSWQLIGTATGASWESLGPTDAFDHIAGPNAGMGNGFGFVGRVGDVWVAETYQDGERSQLYWSEDGRHWSVASQPSIEGNVQISGSGMLRDRMLVLGWSFIDFDHVESFILSSTDGKTWASVTLGLPSGAAVDGLACNLEACVVAELPRDDGSTQRSLWVTNDGTSWAKVSMDLPMAESGSPVRLIRGIGSGFIAIAGYSDTALLSADGRTWRLIDGIKPAVSRETLVNLAVAGDLVVGFGDSGSSDVRNALWRGSLAAMLAAP